MQLSRFSLALSTVLLLGPSLVSWAEPTFVNGLALPGELRDKAALSKERVGYFSDIYYDPNRNEWWSLSDRGPGGGVLSYGTRVQRFTLNIHPATGAVSRFKIVETVLLKNKVGEALDGITPGATLDSSNLGNSFDPEGIVVNPVTSTFLVSDEYGPSLYEFDRDGTLLRAFKTPESLKPTRGDASYNFDNDDNALPADKVVTGRRTNRGFEGLAISPDGDYAYAMLQSAMVNEGGGNGFCNRIVKFDTETGIAVAQYAYKMEASSQGRGISALVALNEDEFLVLERNNRGIGVGAEATPPNKKVYRISIAGAAEVSSTVLDSTNCAGLSVTKNSTPFLDLGANTLADLGNKVPEKWEGLAIGPQLNGGSHLLLAGTDNDYSVTQNGSGTQFDVYFKFSDADPYVSSIQCPIGQVTGCFYTTGGTPATLTTDYKLLPGVLHAYKASASDLAGYQPPL
jgi:hypothetical protein